MNRIFSILYSYSIQNIFYILTDYQVLIRISWRAYLNILILAPSAHYRRWTLILCAGTLDLQIHQCVARTKVMATLILTYLHVL